MEGTLTCVEPFLHRCDWMDHQPHARIPKEGG